MVTAFASVFSLGGAVAFYAYQMDEWLTLRHMQGRYVSPAEVRRAMLAAEYRDNLMDRHWLCLESKPVDQCKKDYYDDSREQIRIEQQKP